jgi:hypothetical protein
VDLTPWAQTLANEILKQPQGAWFMSVAAGLEYMFGKVQHTPHSHDEDEEEDGSEDADEFDSEEEKAARAREEAGADWMVEQGFDRKD